MSLPFSTWTASFRIRFKDLLTDTVPLSKSMSFQVRAKISPSYYKVVVFIDPLQGLYAILFGDTVDWFIPPTT